MFLLVLGVLIWIAAHLLRIVAPGVRESMQQKFGNASKIIIAIPILLSLALMIAGYRSAEYVHLWQAPVWMTYVNNVLMVLALYIYFTTATVPGTAFMFGSLANPQLTGFKVWAVAHLLVNGDLASLLLFGGLLVWAVLQVVLSKGTVSLVDRSLAPIKSPWVHLAVVFVALMVISVVHALLGKWPFAVV